MHDQGPHNRRRSIAVVGSMRAYRRRFRPEATLVTDSADRHPSSGAELSLEHPDVPRGMPDPGRVTRDGSYCDDVGGCFVVRRVPNPGRNVWLSRRTSRHRIGSSSNHRSSRRAFPQPPSPRSERLRVAVVAAGPMNRRAVLWAITNAIATEVT